MRKSTFLAMAFLLSSMSAYAAPCYEDEYIPEAIECQAAVNDGFADFQGTGCQVVPAYIKQVEISCDVIIDITTNRTGFTIKDLFDAQHPGEWQKSDKNKILNIHPNVVVGSSSGDAVVIGGSWQGTLTLNVMGEIQGFAGAANGGAGGNAINANTSGSGGAKMDVNVAATGAIRGGGGGGGRGGNGGSGGNGYYSTTVNVREPSSGYLYNDDNGFFSREEKMYDTYYTVVHLRWGGSLIWRQGGITGSGKIPSYLTSDGYTYFSVGNGVYRTYSSTSNIVTSGGAGGAGGTGGNGQGYGVTRASGNGGASGAVGGTGAGNGGVGATGGAGGTWGTAGSDGAVGAVGGWGNHSGGGSAGYAGSGGGSAGAAILNKQNVSLSIAPGGEVNGAR